MVQVVYQVLIACDHSCGLQIQCIFSHHIMQDKHNSFSLLVFFLSLCRVFKRMIKSFVFVASLHSVFVCVYFTHLCIFFWLFVCLFAVSLVSVFFVCISLYFLSVHCFLSLHSWRWSLVLFTQYLYHYYFICICICISAIFVFSISVELKMITGPFHSVFVWSLLFY